MKYPILQWFTFFIFLFYAYYKMNHLYSYIHMAYIKILKYIFKCMNFNWIYIFLNIYSWILFIYIVQMMIELNRLIDLDN